VESERVRFRLHSPVAAVSLMQRGSEDGVFVNLPAGTLTALLGPSPGRYGMVEICSQGNYYLVFDEDLSERPDPLLTNPM
jgi:hypothetical protein